MDRIFRYEFTYIGIICLLIIMLYQNNLEFSYNVLTGKESNFELYYRNGSFYVQDNISQYVQDSTYNKVIIKNIDRKLNTLKFGKKLIFFLMILDFVPYRKIYKWVSSKVVGDSK